MLQTRELLDSLQSTINSTAPTDNDDNSRKMKGKLDGNYGAVLSLKDPSEVGSSSTSANSTNSTPQKSDSTTDVGVRNQGLGSTGGIWGGVDGGGVGSDIQQYVLVGEIHYTLCTVIYSLLSYFILCFRLLQLRFSRMLHAIAQNHHVHMHTTTQYLTNKHELLLFRRT